MHADSDIAYAIKPAWASYLAFIDQVQADGAFQAEYGMSACLPNKHQGALLRGGMQATHAALHSELHLSLSQASAACGYSACICSCRAVNGGNYVMLPTPGSIAMFEGWSAAAHDGIREGQHDQQFLDRIWERIFRRCLSRDSCEHVRGEVSGGASGRTACWACRTLIYGGLLPRPAAADPLPCLQACSCLACPPAACRCKTTTKQAK